MRWVRRALYAMAVCCLTLAIAGLLSEHRESSLADIGAVMAGRPDAMRSLVLLGLAFGGLAVCWPGKA